MSYKDIEHPKGSRNQRFQSNLVNNYGVDPYEKFLKEKEQEQRVSMIQTPDFNITIKTNSEFQGLSFEKIPNNHVCKMNGIKIADSRTIGKLAEKLHNSDNKIDLIKEYFGWPFKSGLHKYLPVEFFNHVYAKLEECGAKFVVSNPMLK